MSNLATTGSLVPPFAHLRIRRFTAELTAIRELLPVHRLRIQVLHILPPRLAVGVTRASAHTVLLTANAGTWPAPARWFLVVRRPTHDGRHRLRPAPRPTRTGEHSAAAWCLGHVLPDNRGHERAATDSRRVSLTRANPCDQER